MPDYYAILWRTLKTGDYESPQWRNSVFDRTRQVLVDQMRARRPPLSNSEIKLQTDVLDAAIKTIQSEFVRNGSGGGTASELRYESSRLPRPVRPDERPVDGDAADTAPFRFNRIIWAGAAVVVAALAAGIYAFEATSRSDAPPLATKAETTNKPAAPDANKQAAAPATGRPAASMSADGDLAPGVDGGSTDADVPFFFRRQPVFYRTTHPVGTIIVDKPQHFLYLIQPNLVALRYGIGVGRPCADAAGLRRVASKVEWPEWRAPADTAQRKAGSPAVLPGGPGNPLGARLIGLDDGTTRIHGTNAPKTIGSFLNSGCIRLVNDDVVDLYNRMAMDARVVLSD
jgi:lipoprotein-anchoring transpeptidase ErfK/SrfK